jgi:hypothetical protein
VVWETNLESARARARAENKPILMLVEKASCPACTSFKHGLGIDPGVPHVLRRTVPLSIQLEGMDGKPDPVLMAVAAAYKVDNLPSVQLLGAEGNVIRRFKGEPKAKDLAAFVEGNARPGQAADAPDAAGLTFPEPKHVFGTVVGDLVLRHQFQVVNTGKTPLTIKQANSSCGCTSTVVGKAVLAPGETGGIEALFNTKDQRGKVTRTIEVISDDPANPKRILTLEAEVVPEVFVDPPIAQFLEVQGKETRTEQVQLKSGRKEPLHVTRIDIQGGDFITASVGMDTRLHLQLDPQRIPADQRAGMVLVRVATSREGAPVVVLPVRWSLKSPISVQPAGLSWDEFAGGTQRGRVTLRQVGLAPFKILSVESSHRDIHVSVPLGRSATSQEATVQVSNTVNPGLYKETIRFTTDDPDQSVVVVPVRLLVRERPKSEGDRGASVHASH